MNLCGGWVKNFHPLNAIFSLKWKCSVIQEMVYIKKTYKFVLYYSYYSSFVHRNFDGDSLLFLPITGGRSFFCKPFCRHRHWLYWECSGSHLAHCIHLMMQRRRDQCCAVKDNGNVFGKTCFTETCSSIGWRRLGLQPEAFVCRQFFSVRAVYIYHEIHLLTLAVEKFFFCVLPRRSTHKSVSIFRGSKAKSVNVQFLSEKWLSSVNWKIM